MLKKTNFSQPEGTQNLSIAVFLGLNLTKHCNAQTNQLFQALKLTKHCNAQKIPNFKEFAPGLVIDARILEFLEFFEHYSVS